MDFDRETKIFAALVEPLRGMLLVAAGDVFGTEVLVAHAVTIASWHHAVPGAAGTGPGAGRAARLSRQYLDPVAARVREVDRPAAAAVGDLIGLGLLRVGPVRRSLARF